MIGSFWNLCRACPSMPVDKLHSEYRSTYRWHEYTGNNRPEVVRRPPVPNQFGPINEPPLPRRKKCPELAYKSNEFIIAAGEVSNTRTDSTRARSEERGTPSRRSKSEGPPIVPNGRAYPYESEVVGKNIGNTSIQAGESSGLFKKTITKLSTEYRLQFVWPHVRKAITGPPNDDNVDLPRKSHSMGTIKSTTTAANTMPTVNKKRTTNQKEATAYELEPLVNDSEDRKVIDKQPTKKDVRAHFNDQQQQPQRPSQFNTSRENFGFAMQNGGIADNKTLMNGGIQYNEQWVKEVIALRKKADEYKCRGWGIEIDPDLYKKQRELWDQVSKRSSLSALSLASSVHRPITKEEKEQENNKKTAPSRPAAGKLHFPGQAHLIFSKTTSGDGGILPSRVQTIRHHLERTTGPDVEEGALLPSPTREKLMPTIPKSKENEPFSSQKGSPKKSATSRHGSPQKGSPQKGSPKKTLKGRSQSVGPGVADLNESPSPKRQLRSASTAPAGGTATTGTAAPATTAPTSKTSAKKATTPSSERRPRPSTLSTTIHSRTKSSSLPPPTGRGGAHSAPGNHHLHNQLQIQNDTNNKTSSTTLSSPHQIYLRNKNRASSSSNRQTRPKSTVGLPSSSSTSTTSTTSKQTGDLMKRQDKELAQNGNEAHDKDGPVSITSSSPHPAVNEMPEHIVKSPPEPTRVKSPEQIIMRSPDPVNWTVPLDTGKTFTVTQNVKDGESFSRPQSEVKASTPIERPPPAPQSAPPELAEQEKMEGWKSELNDLKKTDSPTPSSTSSAQQPSSVGMNLNKNATGATSSTTGAASVDSSSPSSSSVTTGASVAAVSTTAPAAGVPHTTATATNAAAPLRYDKPVPGSTLRCLDDPSFMTETNPSHVSGSTVGLPAAPVTITAAGITTMPSAPSKTSTTSNDTIEEEARDRFDRFWGGNKDANA